MKYFTIILFLTVLPFTTKCQILKGRIVFKLFSVIDTIHPSEHESEGQLFFDINEKKSVYVTDRNLKLEQNQNIYDKKDDGIIVVRKSNPNSSGDKTGRVVFKSFIDKKLVFRDGFNGKSYIINDSYPEIDWQILDSSKSIKGLICQKAEGDFRGRHYTAWFTNKIPIMDGPWKLCGLPGLILEAYDEKKYFRFETQLIEFPLEFEEKIEIPSLGEKIEFASFYKIREEAYKDFPKKVQAMLGEKTTGFSSKFSINLLERNISQ